jgi:hypothetical protein
MRRAFYDFVVAIRIDVPPSLRLYAVRAVASWWRGEILASRAVSLCARLERACLHLYERATSNLPSDAPVYSDVALDRPERRSG